MSKKEEDRNQEMIRDYQESSVVYGRRVWKYKVVEIAKKYGITDARLQQVLDMYNIPKRSSYKIISVKK